MIPWRKLQAGLSGKGNAKDIVGVVQHIANTTITQIKETTPASHINSGVIRIATTAEVNTATDATIAVSPDDLSASNYGVQVIGVLVEAGDVTLGTGDAKNGNYFRIPSVCNGWDIVAVAGQVFTVGSTGTASFQLRNVTDSVDVLSTKLTIDSAEKDSLMAAVAAVISGTADDVATGDQFTWDVDSVHSVTAPKGLYCEVILRKP